jgi:hypothetical protein
MPATTANTVNPEGRGQAGSARVLGWGGNDVRDLGRLPVGRSLGNLREQLGNCGRSSGGHQQPQPFRPEDHRAVDLPVHDRGSGGGLVRIPMHLEGARPLGSDLLGCRFSHRTGPREPDRQVAGGGSGRRPREGRDQQRE